MMLTKKVKAEKNMQSKRIVWIDWMKTIGMLLIIWGHCFPEGMSSFIYAFNVPVFFIVSGFLTHREPSMRVCFDKTLHNLVIPYFILAFIKAAGYMFKHISDGQWLWSVIAIFGGFHRLHDASGCSNLWFVYTLILIKLIYQSLPYHRMAISLISICGAIIYQYVGIEELSWSVTNVLTALPFFMLGNYLATNKFFDKCTARIQQMDLKGWMLLFLSLIAVTYVVSYFNDSAKLYQGLYGNSLILFTIASLTGSCIVYILSVKLNDFNWKWMQISAIGTIVTLVFHRELLHPLIKWIDKTDMGIIEENIALFLSSVLVLLAFVPIILLVKRVFPIVLGRRIRKSIV